jgi:hypothetical protein
MNASPALKMTSHRYSILTSEYPHEDLNDGHHEDPVDEAAQVPQELNREYEVELLYLNGIVDVNQLSEVKKKEEYEDKRHDKVIGLLSFYQWINPDYIA